MPFWSNHLSLLIKLCRDPYSNQDSWVCEALTETYDIKSVLLHVNSGQKRFAGCAASHHRMMRWKSQSLDLPRRRAAEPSGGERGRCGICCFWRMGQRRFNYLTVSFHLRNIQRTRRKRNKILNLRIPENPTSLLVLSPTPPSPSLLSFSQNTFFLLFPHHCIPLSSNIFCPLLFCCHSADTAYPFLFFFWSWFGLWSQQFLPPTPRSVYSITRPGPPLPRYRQPRYQRHIPQM